MAAAAASVVSRWWHDIIAKSSLHRLAAAGALLVVER